jgi:hypothetical protein
MSSASKKTDNRLRIIVLGYIVRGPMGGMAWHHLQYLMGLRDLGHDVYFIEDSGDTLFCCYDPTRHVTDKDPRYGLKFAAYAFKRVGLSERWAYFNAHSELWLGPLSNRILNICENADLLLNLSCANSLRPWLMEVPVRALIDTDPVFTQIRNLTDPDRKALSSLHTVFFTFGENISLSHCVIPDDGFPWQATRQPTVLDAWPLTPGPKKGNFTTVMQWDSHPTREYKGHRYGMKSGSFKDYMDLPEYATGSIFEIAMGGKSAPRNVLRSKGWTLCNPLEISRDPWTYQRYIQRSKGEFSVAKHGYVVSHSAWFSERSAAYLASGRPVVVQDTGFSDWMETGSGVLSFNDPNEALAGIEEINSSYGFHCRAAREIAREYFNANNVLFSLIERAVNPSPIPMAKPLEEAS